MALSKLTSVAKSVARKLITTYSENSTLFFETEEKMSYGATIGGLFIVYKEGMILSTTGRLTANDGNGQKFYVVAGSVTSQSAEVDLGSGLKAVPFGDAYSFVPADEVGALKGKFNIKPTNPFAQIASDVHTCWIGYGGHESFNNIIGTIPSSGANYSGVLGYDNKTDALATAMWHFHGSIETAADHPTMIGGSFGRIQGGSYTVVLGGTQNNIVGGNYTAILGGRNNTINPASGAVITGGYGNINGGAHSTCSGGLSNLLGSSCDQSVISGGGGNTATNTATTISGGVGNTASGGYSAVSGGQDNEAVGSYSRAAGREALTQYGCDTYASGGFANVAGSAQIFDFVTRRATTSATESDQYLDGAAVKLTIPENSAWAIKTQCVASDGTDRAVFEFNSLVFRGAGSTASSPTQNDSVTVIHKTAGAASWSHRVTATTSGGINVKCTGEAGKTIRWVTRCTATQLFD